jgi:hypothetical protein
MKDASLLILKLAYGYLLLLYVPLAFMSMNVNANVAALLSLTAIAFVVIAHVAVWRKKRATLSPRGFFFLSLLWGIYLVAFLANEGCRLLFGEGPFFLVETDLFFLPILLLITSLSFLFRKPFWYTQNDSKSTVAIGIIGFIFFACLIVVQIIELAEHTKFMIESEAIKSLLKNVEKQKSHTVK